MCISVILGEYGAHYMHIGGAERTVKGDLKVMEVRERGPGPGYLLGRKRG